MKGRGPSGTPDSSQTSGQPLNDMENQAKTSDHLTTGNHMELKDLGKNQRKLILSQS